MLVCGLDQVLILPINHLAKLLNLLNFPDEIGRFMMGLVPTRYESVSVNHLSLGCLDLLKFIRE